MSQNPVTLRQLCEDCPDYPEEIVDSPAIDVLLIEDNDTDALLVREALADCSRDRYTVTQAHYLREAIELARTNHYAIALLDLGLPDSRTIDTFVQLNSAVRSLPIIVLTGLDDDDTGTRAVRLGAQDCIAKRDINSKLLSRCIRNARERFRLSQQIEQSREAESRTQKMEALGTLAGGIAHDFNNILLAINGNTEVALETIDASHPVYVRLCEIARAGSRASELVRRILSFSRQGQPKREAFRLETVVKEALALLRSTLPTTIEIHSHFEAKVPKLLIDATEVHQLVLNLVTNASHAIGDGPGRIDVGIGRSVPEPDSAMALGSRDAEGICLWVSDTGCGMSADTVTRMFDPFFTTKPIGLGSGLGLSAVHSIMRSYGGGIAVRTAPGEGTTFRLYFPLEHVTSSDDTASVEIIDPARLAGGRGERILYVDDEASLVTLVTHVLHAKGYRVTGYGDAVEALNAFRASPRAFDLVLTDLSMPGMRGFALAQAIRALRADVPVIVTTGFARPEDEEDARRLGVSTVLLKSNLMNELPGLLHDLLRPLAAQGFDERLLA